jgi:hypothetical protein
MAGRKPAKITGKQREQIRTLAGYGLLIDQIAEVMGIPKRTMQRHCKQDLAKGKAVAIAAVQQTLFRMATSGRIPSATYFYLKCVAGWRETDRPQDQEKLPAARLVLADQLDDNPQPAPPQPPPLRVITPET